MRYSKNTLSAVLAIAALTVTAPLSAHADLVKSSPAAQASVTAPRTLLVTFNEKLIPAFSKLELTMVGNAMTIPVKTRLSRDGKTLIGTPERAPMKGPWSLKWTAATSDGHREQGTITFRVK